MTNFTSEQLAELTPNDRREIRNFERWLKLWPKHSKKMLTRERWQKYLGLFPNRAQ